MARQHSGDCGRKSDSSKCLLWIKKIKPVVKNLGLSVTTMKTKDTV